MRKIISFNTDWYFHKSDEEAASVTLPHTWNAEDGQDGGNDYWRGTGIYTKRFAMIEHQETERVFIEFNGAAMCAEVLLNGTCVASHEGGYSTFRADLTDLLKDQNELTVKVDNSSNDRIYPQKADFTFYGGLYRDVNLVIVPEEHFELLKDGTPGIKVTPVVSPDLKRTVVTAETWHNAKCVSITVNGETKTVANKAEFVIENVHLWDGLNDPYLYTAEAVLESGDSVSVRFGCRRFRFDKEKGFFLNERSYPLHGVARHQDLKGKGNALSLEDHRHDMEIVREIGANTVRLAHYQQAQEFYDLCDENGIVVWAEIPYITAHMPNGRANTLSQMKELITQSYHHPSIVCWGLSNEITASGEVTEDLLENHRMLNDLCHHLDGTRPTTMAHVFMLETDSPLIDIADIGSYNLYFGWYLGELEQNDRFFDDFHKTYPERIIGFSEYGADANTAFHSSHPEQGDYSEEYQCVYHEHILNMIEQRPYLWATHVWNLFDFAADGRDEGGKKGENQKGLVEFDHRTKKDAFYLYKAAWNKEPFVHICGRRYIDRSEAETEIRVYSNCDSVTLFKDGTELETKQGRRVFVFRVSLEGEHEIKAVSGTVFDTIKIRKAGQENATYRLGSSGAVTNWFDKDTCDPNCFSIKDSLGAIMANPAAAAVLAPIMKRAAASRGDVAESTSGNATLQKMMAPMSLESLLKKAGEHAVSPEEVKTINDTLQKIRKG